MNPRLSMVPPKRTVPRDDSAADLERYRVPGVTAFLEEFRDVPKAVGSNAEPANIDFALEGLGLAQYFQVTVDGSQVQRPKPYPDIYLLAAKRLGVAPANCIVFEDSPLGLPLAWPLGCAWLASRPPRLPSRESPFTLRTFSTQASAPGCALWPRRHSRSPPFPAHERSRKEGGPWVGRFDDRYGHDPSDLAP